jgi:two-component sensor histidine kinase
MDRTIALKRERRDAEVLEIFRTNRGKALMDEANVFLSSIIRGADERLTAGAAAQTENASLLRLVTIVGGILIVLVVGIVIFTVLRYARDLTAARDEVGILNRNLERRVEERTVDLERARDRAQVLLAEVNHRVSNSLALVASMVGLQARAVESKVAKDALGETQARIYAISLIHKRLYSASDVRVVALDEYLAGLLDQLDASMRDEGHGGSLVRDLDPLQLPTDRSVNLGVVLAEWVTNAFKYAYPDRSGEIRVRLKGLPDRRGELVVEDDGVGRGADGTVKGTGLGTRVVSAMAASMGAEVEYPERRQGTAARLVFPLQAS